jgi:hypothetical protein
MFQSQGLVRRGESTRRSRPGVGAQVALGRDALVEERVEGVLRRALQLAQRRHGAGRQHVEEQQARAARLRRPRERREVHRGHGVVELRPGRRGQDPRPVVRHGQLAERAGGHDDVEAPPELAEDPLDRAQRAPPELGRVRERLTPGIQPVEEARHVDVRVHRDALPHLRAQSGVAPRERRPVQVDQVDLVEDLGQRRHVQVRPVPRPQHAQAAALRDGLDRRHQPRPMPRERLAISRDVGVHLLEVRQRPRARIANARVLRLHVLVEARQRAREERLATNVANALRLRMSASVHSESILPEGAGPPESR